MRGSTLIRFISLIALALAVVLLATPEAAQAQWGDACSGALPPRLVPGQQGRVTPGLPNLMRSQPGTHYGSQVVGSIPAGAYFDVVYGYASQCANGMWWTLINYNNIQGWTPEGSAWGVYWTEPVNYQPSPPACPLPTRLVAGQQGRVTPGLPNVVRSQPGQGWNSVIVGQIPAGGIFTVLAGYVPQCANGIQWHYVNYNGLIGWTAEGQHGVYWTEPVSYQPQPDPNTCPAGNTRLSVYGWGRVTPGLPNNVRAEPSLSGRWVGRIPAGATFHILGGPICNNGIFWWQVNYNGLIGWTGEGRYGVYWLEPVI
jgi:uncharacterized protein YraI